MLDERTQHAEAVNPEVHHESSDVDVRAILWATVILVVFGIVSHVFLYFHFQFMRRAERQPDLLPISLVDRDKPNLPPGPRLQPFPTLDGEGRALSPLQTNPPYDMDQMRVEEERELNTWGWENQAAGIVRMPIDRAMELQLQRGFPVAPQEQAAGEPAGFTDRPAAAPVAPAAPGRIETP